MKRTVRSVTVVVLLIVLSSAVQSALALVPLRTLSVRLTDLGPGYVVANGLMPSGLQKTSFTAFRDNVSAKALKLHGWSQAYHAQFQGKRKVNSDVVAFTTSTGARWFFTINRNHEVNAAGARAIVLARVGDNSAGYSQPGGIVGIVLQRGRYVEDIAVSPGVKTFTIRLARAVSRRMATAG